MANAKCPRPPAVKPRKERRFMAKLWFIDQPLSAHHRAGCEGQAHQQLRSLARRHYKLLVVITHLEGTEKRYRDHLSQCRPPTIGLFRERCALDPNGSSLKMRWMRLRQPVPRRACWRTFATGAAAVREQVAVVVVDLFDAQRSSRDVIEAWVDVVVDRALVTVGGARTELWTSAWNPRLG